MLIALLSGVACFFSGAYIGTVIDNATEAEDVKIVSAQTSVTESKNNSLSTDDLIKAGALGVCAWFIYKKFLK